MSEPSPEAKQAAGECCEGLLDEAAMAHIIQQAIDTATAKLRGSLLDLAEASAKETAKLREELEISKNFAEALMHQRDEIASRLVDQQPSAPTADVEKTVMEFANNEYEENKLRKVVAQARAPLVEAGKQAIPRLERCMCAGSNGHRLNLKIAKTLAALTGTGEK